MRLEPFPRRCGDGCRTRARALHSRLPNAPRRPRRPGPMQSPPDAVVSFGPFVLDRRRKTLLRDGQPVRLGGRAMDLLEALVAKPGEVLSRDTLVAQVWPRVVVEETSLRVHVAALRKALGDGFIANIPGRGYSFVAPVAPVGLHAPALPDTLPTSRHLPVLLTRPVGRDDTIAALSRQVVERRLVTLVGPGGMGKTTTAIAVGAVSMAAFPDGVRFVDLSPVTDPHRVPAAFADTFGIVVPPENPWPALDHALRPLRVLVVLDNCEHLIDAVALLTDTVLSAAAGVHILATSHEPLDTPGEWVHHLPPLGLPDAHAPASGPEAPSVELFLERAPGDSQALLREPANLALVRHVCRRLDGLPLAIELAATRIDTLGIQGLADGLDNMLDVLTRGRRTASPRHQTLQATLDWSHGQLDDPDRTVLRRLSVFRAPFTVDDAVRVATCERLGVAAVTASLVTLVAKSLVVADPRHDPVRLRLLGTTQAYVATRLRETGEFPALAARHAEHVLRAVSDAVAEIQAAPVEDAQRCITHQARLLDDVRAALDWASSPEGDPRLAAKLGGATGPLTMALGRIDEFRPRMQLAFEQAVALDPPDPELEFGAGMALCMMNGHSTESQQPLLGRLRDLATRIGPPARLHQVLEHDCMTAFTRGAYPESLEAARAAQALCEAPDDPASVFFGDRMLAQALHHLGRHGEARERAERVLAHPSRLAHWAHASHIPVAISLPVLLARIHWLEGRVDDAAALIDETARRVNLDNPHELTLVYGLGLLPVALWRGDLALARTALSRFRDHALQHSQSFWISWSRVFTDALGDTPGAPTPRAGKEADMAATLRPERPVPEARRRVEAGTVGWCAPEVLRADAMSGLHTRRLSAGEAEAGLMRSLALARAQGALSWELRTASSLVELCAPLGRGDEARRRLAAVVDRFTQGGQTRDLLQARALLDGADPA